MTNNSVPFFTDEENSILANWLSVDPVGSSGCLSHRWEVLEKLGFEGKTNGYNDSDAPDVSIVLERIQDGLP